MRRFALHAIVALVFVAAALSPQRAAAGDPPAADDVRKWAVDRMVAWSRPGVSLLPAAVESFDDGKERYGSIANAVLAVVSKERPIFGGPKGRLRTAALLLAVSMFESSYRKDVDHNLGKEGRGDGGRSWCLMQVQLGIPVYVDSSGRRVQMQQVCSVRPAPWDETKTVRSCELVPPPGSVASTPTRIVLTDGGYELTSDQLRGHSGQDLVADRELCFTAGLRILRNSMGACSSLPILERLSAYASGNCSDGREASRRRMSAAVRWVSSYPPPVDDLRLVKLFGPPSPDAPDAVASIAK